MIQRYPRAEPSANQAAGTSSPYTETGVTLNAVAAMRSDQETFTRAQTAYLFAVAYEIGRRHTLAENLAETIAGWDERIVADGRCTVVRPAIRDALLSLRDRRKAARLAEYERCYGPPKFTGGLPKPPAYYTDDQRTPPPFPTLAGQSAWLTADDIAYLKREARHLADTTSRGGMRRAA